MEQLKTPTDTHPCPEFKQFFPGFSWGLYLMRE